MRLTKIICTLGPSSNSPAMIRKLADNGMDIARINFSHGDGKDHLPTIRAVKEMNAQEGRSIALMLDTKGAEIRTGVVEKPIEVKAGEEVVFSSTPMPGEKRPVIQINYDKFAHDVKKAECILLENGTLPFDIVSISDDGKVVGRSRDDGSIGSRRHVNLPGADVSLPSMTDKDWKDLEIGMQEEMDYVALSFIRTAEEVEEVRAFLKKHNSTMQIMTKIETRQAVADIVRIIHASDSIMVARGDLGAEMAYQKIPAVQDMIVQRCREASKPVLVATQMLESMIEHPMPTRAEVTDVAHAATTRADATMLSGETAAGEHPIEAVTAMRTILEETESHLLPELSHHRCPFGESSALADAAVSTALAIKSPAILVLTRSGRTAQAVSTLRSGLPILACTESDLVARQLRLWHAVSADTITFDADPEVTLDRAFEKMMLKGLLASGQKVVVIADVKRRAGSVHTVHIRTIQ